ncbi:hypothetical protein KXD40_001139 [Peronospora effusa]|uniref:Helicase Sen1 N-terminal domain-containing protein n=1 Tax=Peronospora effusa TaxID=542832 RepID=A0A3M6VFV0_9STRA|nr:hypothetical protein DD238_002538 [Peronospora effusa]RQM09567.1 hypothetical protein DD237_003260 [Peronospora effusa]UIZ21646.1 hypothetical protein KXD40_001139 [Peronospora effusa]
MEIQARALEDEVRQLCDQEQTKHTTLLKQRLYSRVGQFLMDNLEIHHCVDIYHASMPSVHVELEFEFTPDSIKSFFVKLQGLDADRVRRQLANTSMGLANTSSNVLETVAVTLYEVLSHRRLLSDFRIVRVLSKWISCRFSDVKANPSLECLRGCPGLYQLLVSPDPAVRGWAKETVQHFGKIQLSGDYGNDQYLLNVLDEWMYILESEEFNKSVLSLDLKTTEDLQDVSALPDI